MFSKAKLSGRRGLLVGLVVGLLLATGAFINVASPAGWECTDAQCTFMGNVGIGTQSPNHKLEIHGTDNSLVVLSTGTTGPAANVGLELRTTSPTNLAYIDFTPGSTDTSGSGTPDFGGRIRYDGGAFNIYGGNVGIFPGGPMNPRAPLHVVGDFLVTDGRKMFAQDHPADPTKQIVYVSLEGPEAGTYIRGTAELVNGKAVIDLPEHFSLVTNDEGLTVQLTSRGEWLQLYLVETTTKRIIVREVQGKSGQFDYLVQGVRKGYENHQVIQEKQK